MVDLYPRSACDNFTVSESHGEPSYTRPGLRTSIISQGMVCTGRQECEIPAGGFVSDARTLNITTSSASDIFALISSVTNITFEEILTGNITTTSWPIANGTFGYVGFTPNHRCTSGVLNGCNSDIPDGTVIEACTPYVGSGAVTGKQPALSGTVAVITTSRDIAMSLTCNPANTTDPSQAPNNACMSTAAATTSEGPAATQTSSGAASLAGRGQGSGFSAIFIGAIGFFLGCL